MSQMEKIRCLIVGDDGSGVSSLALSYLSSFPTAAQLSSPATNSGYERRAVMVDGQPSTLCLWWGNAVNANIWTDDSFLPDHTAVPHRTISTLSTDASSPSSSSSMMADAALICVDISISPTRVTGIAAMWLQRIRSRFPHCCVFLVGTKIDQRPPPPPPPSSSSSGRGSSSGTVTNRNSPDRTSASPLTGSHVSSSPSLGTSSIMTSALSRSASTNGLASAAVAVPLPPSSSPPPPSSSSLVASSSSIADMAGIVTARRYLTHDEGYACATAASSSLSLTSTLPSSVATVSTSKGADYNHSSSSLPLPLPLRYLECSALSRDGVQMVFDTVVQTVRHQRALLAAPPTPTKSQRGTCVIS